MSKIHIERLHSAPRNAEALASLLDQGWPAFISADPVAETYLAAVRDRFSELELLAVHDGHYVGAGWAVEIVWDGNPNCLPEGYSDALRRSVSSTQGAANTLVVCAAQVEPAEQGHGVAAELLRAFRQLAATRGCEHLIIPLRPTLKHRYPLTPIAEYARWTRTDGTAFDPWLRTHLRLGAHVIAMAPRSQTMTGTRGEWEGWTGLDLPAPGDYIIPGGLAPLAIDEMGRGSYVEPNIWVQHPL